MASDFTKDTACLSLFKFETGALTADSIGSNTLTAANTPTADADCKEGSYSTLLVKASHQYYERTDANLPAGWPFKNGDTTKIMTVAVWFKAVALSGWQGLVGKGKFASNDSWHIATSNATLYFCNGSQNINMASTISTGVWYHLILSINGVTKAYQWRLYNATTGAFTYGVGSTTNTVNATANALRIGGWSDQNTLYTWDGYIDEVVFFNRILNSQEMSAVRNQGFEGAFAYGDTTKHMIDPVNGHDAQSGDCWFALPFTGGTGSQPVAGETITGASSGVTAKVYSVAGTWGTAGYIRLSLPSGAFTAGETVNFTNGGACVAVTAGFNCAWKTCNHSYADGDNVYIVKAVETALTGTVTATLGSNTIVTTNDLTATAPAGTIIRIGESNAIYKVLSITSSAITLYRCYRGSSGSGLSITKLDGTTLNALTNTWTLPTGGNGATLANPCNMYGGINTDNLAQDGFSLIVNDNSGYGFQGTWSYWNFSRMAFVNWSRCWFETANYCIFTDCYEYHPSSNNQQTLNNCTVIRFICEDSAWGPGNVNNSDFYDMDVFQLSLTPLLLNAFFYNTKCQGRTNSATILFNNATLMNVHFFDTIVNEQGAVVSTWFTMGSGNATCYCSDVSFHNTQQNGAILPTNIMVLSGIVGFANTGGSATDHKMFQSFGSGVSLYGAKYSRETTVYNIDSQCVKILFGNMDVFQIWKMNYPCDAGVAKTVSIYFRKDANYGSLYLPMMKVRWITGTAGALVNNIHIVAMPDVNDSWQQVSYTVTPSIKGDITVELWFKTLTTGGIAYFSDFAVT